MYVINCQSTGSLKFSKRDETLEILKSGKGMGHVMNVVNGITRC